jgi:hypothetical protein
MINRPPELDMTVDGAFRTPPKPPLLNRILVWAVIVAVLAGSLVVAALALWLALIILPVAIGAALIAWIVYRYHAWRSAGSLRGGQVGGRDIYRP